METGSRVEARRNCLILSAVVFTPPTRTRQDKTVLSCPCRRCEQAIRLMSRMSAHLDILCRNSVNVHNTALKITITERLRSIFMQVCLKFTIKHSFVHMSIETKFNTSTVCLNHSAFNISWLIAPPGSSDPSSLTERAERSDDQFLV